MELTVKSVKDCSRITKALSKTDALVGATYYDKYELRRSIEKSAVDGLYKTW